MKKQGKGMDDGRVEEGAGKQCVQRQHTPAYLVGSGDIRRDDGDDDNGIKNPRDGK